MVLLLFPNQKSLIASLITTIVVGLLLLPSVVVVMVMGQQDENMIIFPDELPSLGDLIELAFPTWCIDEDERRIYDVETCGDENKNEDDDGSTTLLSPNGQFTPLYFTKQFNGMDPNLGGYPTDIDTQYPFNYAAPFLGQACAGTPHHCSELFDGANENCGTCPKIKTDNDSGPNGPGHVPPHIALAALTRSYNELVEESNITASDFFSDAFDYEQNACRILPSVLLLMVREYYPRNNEETTTGSDNQNKPYSTTYYPPPFSDAGGAYPFEFVNLVGESCEKEKEAHPNAGELICFEQHSGGGNANNANANANTTELLYPSNLKIGHGSPHYCTLEGKEADIYNDFCPYIFFGPNRGKYRHPHIAFASIETYLAHLLMPEKCGTTWDDSNYPATVDTSIAFPYMEKIDNYAPDQPLIENGRFLWPGPEGSKKKQVNGLFATGLYVVDNQPQQPPPNDQQQPDSSVVVVKDGCELDQCWDNNVCEWVSSCDVVECGEYNEFCEEENENIPQREPVRPECCDSDLLVCSKDETAECDEDIRAFVGGSYCTYSPDTDCYITGWPACCSDKSSECPEEQTADCDVVAVDDGCESGQCWDNNICEWVSSCDDVECGEYDEFCEEENENDPQREPVGDSYCTYSPDTDCYITGWPTCCSDDSSECPKEQPAECEINLTDGDSYCTYSVDYSCYKYGRPECCEIDSTVCPNQKPECDVPPIFGGSYCTYGPNPECYTKWWPACCSNDSIECPEEQPKCERSPIVPGSSYCTYTPDYSCYDSGRPSCCSDDSIECPKAPPSCDGGACKTLAEIVCEAPDLSELCQLVERAGLKDALSNNGSLLTVFAPRNGGFDSIPVNEFSTDRLKRLLLFHIVANEELYSSDLRCASPSNLITMSNNFDSRTRCKDGIPTYQQGRNNNNGSPPIIVQDDIEACNGVAHVLSEVMLYKDYD